MAKPDLQNDKDLNSMLTKVDDSNSVIGIRNGFSGEFHSDGLLRIDGDFKGVVKGRGVVLVGEAGRILGDVYAASVRISGKVKGNVFALEKVEISNSGSLDGDFSAPRFYAEEGMRFNGKGNTLSPEQLEKIFVEKVDQSPEIIEEDF